MQNLYDLLGVRPDDDAENLRRAYRKAVKESHPDHHGSDPETVGRFRRITEAYGVLRNAERRAAYDERLEFERRPVRRKLGRALSDLKRHAAYDVLAGAVLAVMLATAYQLHVGASATFFDEASVIIARGSGQDSDRPARLNDAAGRGRSEQRVAAPQMPIVGRIAQPAVVSAGSEGSDAGMARRGPDSNPTGEVEIAARAGELDEGVEPVDQREAPSSDIQFSRPPSPSLPSSSSVLVSVDGRDGRAPESSGASAVSVKLPEITMATVRPQIGAKRHVASRADAPVEQTALETRDTASRDAAAADSGPSRYVFGAGN